MQRVRWTPTTAPNIAAYVLLFSDSGAQGAFSERVTVANIRMGTNWDPVENVFFFDDDEVPYRLYRLRTLDVFGNAFDATTIAPFPAGADPAEAPTQYVFPLDHNTGGTDNLRYVTPGGSPVPDATVRVYTKLAWDLRRRSDVVGSTVTAPDGRWKNPIFVEPGNTFVVHFQLPNAWGPDTVEVTV